MNPSANDSLPARIPFWKMSGCGNDFVVIDNRTGIIPRAMVSSFTKSVCSRRISVGADGVVLIQNPAGGSGVDFDWRYINADGNDGEFCGNGSVCGARFAFLNRIAPASCSFSTPNGVVHAEMSGDPDDPTVKIAIADPGKPQLHAEIEIDGVTVSLHLIVVGVPHAVMIVEDAGAFLSPVEFVSFGSAVRHHSFVAPAGVNLNVISMRPDGSIRMRTYERGVEAETLACGSGAIASAVVATALGLTQSPATVITSSGRPLFPSFTWDGVSARNVTLGGEARVVSTGDIWSEAFTPI